MGHGNGGVSSVEYSDLEVNKRKAVRLRAPHGIEPAARGYFEQIIQSLPADHFAPGDEWALLTYCRALVTLDRNTEALEIEGEISEDSMSGALRANPRTAIISRANTTVASLAVKLRLVPSARQDIKAIKEEAARKASQNREAAGQAAEESPLAGFTYGHTVQ